MLLGAASGQVPPFDIQRLNAGGSLLLTRPTLGHHLATRDELEWRARDVLGAVADYGSLLVTSMAATRCGDAAAAFGDLEARREPGRASCFIP